MRFDQEMVVPANLTMVGERGIRVEVRGRRGAVERWNVTEYTKTNGMVVQVKFRDALSIS